MNGVIFYIANVAMLSPEIHLHRDFAFHVIEKVPVLIELLTIFVHSGDHLLKKAFSGYFTKI
jgi:hypothetical protein